MLDKQRFNILLVDDQPAKLLSYEVILAELRQNLVKANSGSEALATLLKTDVALVLVDVCMPDLDGFQFVEMMRQHPRFEKTAVIFISAIHLTDLDRIKGYKSGAVDYIPVPFAPELLRAKVRVFLDLHRKTKQLEQIAAELEGRVHERTRLLEESRASLQESEERLRQALSAANMGTWRLDLATQKWTRDSGLNAILDLSPVDSTQAVDSFDFVHREDRERVATAWNDAVEKRGSYEAEFRVERKDRCVKWVRDQGRYIKGENGAPDCFTGLTVDITQRKQAEDRQALLIQELNHRVKNMLATIQSIAVQSLSNFDKHERDIFLSRIHALATCHNLLTESQWDGARLRDIVDNIFAPHAKDDVQRVVLSGPDALLSSRDALSITLALHELTTNALKYGAFSNETGRVDLLWKIKPAAINSALHLAWQESGGPSVTEPRRRGFGSRLLNSLAAQAGAAYSCDYSETGFKCELSLPLEKAI